MGQVFPSSGLFRQIRNCALKLYVSGAHLSPEFGLTVQMIDQDGFPIEERVEMLLSSAPPLL